MSEEKSDKKHAKAVTVAEKLWEELKDLQLSLFALPAKPLSEFAKPVTIDPSKLFLLTSTGALLPELESVLGSKFNVEKLDKWIVVTKK